jgi:hypothetical protein
MKHKPRSKRKVSTPKSILRLPDLGAAKSARSSTVFPALTLNAATGTRLTNSSTGTAPNPSTSVLGRFAASRMKLRIADYLAPTKVKRSGRRCWRWPTVSAASSRQFAAIGHINPHRNRRDSYSLQFGKRSLIPFLASSQHCDGRTHFSQSQSDGAQETFVETGGVGGSDRYCFEGCFRLARDVGVIRAEHFSETASTWSCGNCDVMKASLDADVAPHKPQSLAQNVPLRT